MIRPGTLDDMDAMLELGRAMHAESTFNHLPFDEQKVRSILTTCMNGFGCVFVAEHNGEVIGGFMGIVSEYWFCHVKCASDLALFVRPDRRGALAAVRLIETYIDFAQAQGIDPRDTQLGISTGVLIERTTKLYESLGFEQVGGIFKLRKRV